MAYVVFGQSQKGGRLYMRQSIVAKQGIWLRSSEITGQRKQALSVPDACTRLSGAVLTHTLTSARKQTALL